MVSRDRDHTSYPQGLFKNHLHFKNRCHRFYHKPRKPIGFWYKIQFSKFGENMKAERGFLFIEWFLTDFLFKIQILNEKGKPASLSLDFFDFQFFKISQNLNCNRSIFGEPKKMD
jgi:hypothetical protein